MRGYQSALSALAAGFILVQCQMLGGFDDFVVGESVSTSTGDGTTTTGGVGGTGGGACVLEKPPSRPVIAPPGGVGGIDEASGAGGISGAGGVGGTGADQTITLAVRRVDFGERPNTILKGLDLDDDFTCSDTAQCIDNPRCGRPSAANPVSWEEARCDGPGGSDSNSRRLFGLISMIEPTFTSAKVSANIDLGEGTLLYVIEGYNGEADDESVFLEVYTTSRFVDSCCNRSPEGPNGGKACPDAEGYPGGEPSVGRRVPKWDGHDVWPVARDSVTNNPMPFCNGLTNVQPVDFDGAAYVANHELVARLKRVRLFQIIGDDAAELEITDATVVAPLRQRPDGSWVTEGGLLAGRLEVSRLFESVAKLKGVKTGCDFDVVSSSARQQVCDAADLIGQDRRDTSSAPCDSVSFASRFDAEPALIGDVVRLPEVTSCDVVANFDCGAARR
ncbi:MAG: hypothetical protein AAGA56_22630 [Myxococcota bacterium]